MGNYRPPLLTTAEVANRLAMSEEWVREQAAELRGIRMGDHRRAQLRFKPSAIEDWVSHRQLAPSELSIPRRRPGPQIMSTGVELLPLPEEGKS